MGYFIQPFIWLIVTYMPIGQHWHKTIHVVGKVMLRGLLGYLLMKKKATSVETKPLSPTGGVESKPLSPTGGKRNQQTFLVLGVVCLCIFLLQLEFDLRFIRDASIHQQDSAANSASSREMQRLFKRQLDGLRVEASESTHKIQKKLDMFPGQISALAKTWEKPSIFSRFASSPDPSSPVVSPSPTEPIVHYCLRHEKRAGEFAAGEPKSSSCRRRLQDRNVSELAPNMWPVDATYGCKMPQNMDVL